jgi:hypothetical protein
MNKVIIRAGEMAGMVEEAERIIASDIESTEIKTGGPGGPGGTTFTGAEITYTKYDVDD